MNRLVIYRRRFARRNQRWRWRLVAANGKKLANGGEGYSDRNICVQYARAIVDGAYREAATVVIG